MPPQIGLPPAWWPPTRGLSRRFSRVPPEWTSWLSLALERIAARGVDWSVPHIRGDPLAGGFPVLSAVRGGPQHPAHGDVIGDPHERGEEGGAKYIVVRMDFLIEMVGQTNGQVVHRVLVVAILGACLGAGLEVLIPLPVGPQGGGQFGHGTDPVLKHQFFHRGQGIGHHRQPNAGDHRTNGILGAPWDKSFPDSMQCSMQEDRKGRGTISW